ncbi:MAG: hemolysin III family protein [Balneolaceae bacterium]
MYKGERLNSYTHLIGALGSCIGFIVLLYLAISSGDPWRITSYTIYGFCLLMLYTFSTLYHSFRGKWKLFFQKMDHIAIYLLIAGTYSPFTLVTLRGEIGWWFFVAVWSLALIGISIDLFRKDGNGNRIIQLLIYLSMGWMVMFAIEPLTNNISSTGFYWLILGGLFYTAGVLFYILSNSHRYAHGIWHMFVLAGSLSHFVTIVGFI